MSKTQSVPVIVLLGLSSPFCRSPRDASDDPDDSVPVFRTIGRSVVDAEQIVIQDIYTGNLAVISQYDHVYPPYPSKVSD